MNKFKSKGLFFSFLLITIFFFIFTIRGKINDQSFFRSKINSKVASQNNWQGRAIEFRLENGLRIDSSALQKFPLEIGDSIVKPSQSWIFEIYKRDNIGNYLYFGKYDFR